MIEAVILSHTEDRIEKGNMYHRLPVDTVVTLLPKDTFSDQQVSDICTVMFN